MGMLMNQTKTVLLLGLLTGVLLVAGGAIGGRGGMTFALVMAVVMNFAAYFFSDKMVLAMYRAEVAKKKEYGDLHSMVEEVARKAHLPKPRVYIVNDSTPNAFATGRNPENAVVAVTTGILNLLDKNELRGVIAHEMAHIKNRDILVVSIAATIAGAISYLAHMAQWAAIFGGMRGNDRDGGNIVGTLAVAILTPFIALLIQMAISRSREYLADAKGAEFIKDPMSLASALEKLHSASPRHKMRNATPETSSMMIVSPFSGGGVMSMLSTHPPMKERVSRLKTMAKSIR